MQLLNLHPKQKSFEEEILNGLRQTPKSVLPKFFYDKKGSELFEQICQLKEYYVTRAELALLEMHGLELAHALGNDCLLFEFGSGASTKTRLLLKHLLGNPVYAPIDISPTMLAESSASIGREFPAVSLLPICADFTNPPVVARRVMTPELQCRRKAAFFPGSTIGNFDPDQALDFLTKTAALLGSGGLLLIGIDLAKDRSILEPAYDDASGVTAAFNLNLLTRINRELGADFDLTKFKHRAFYNEVRSRIEMHLISTITQTVTIRGEEIRFHELESIHTENSYKYSEADFKTLATQSGFEISKMWIHPENRFCVALLMAHATAGEKGFEAA